MILVICSLAQPLKSKKQDITRLHYGKNGIIGVDSSAEHSMHGFCMQSVFTSTKRQVLHRSATKERCICCLEKITVSGESSHAMCSAAPLNTHANACSVAPQGGLCSIAKASSDLAPQGWLCIKGGLCRNVNLELSSTHAS